MEAIWSLKSVHKVKCAVLPSSEIGAHFGSKHPQLILQVLSLLWLKNKLHAPKVDFNSFLTS